MFLGLKFLKIKRPQKSQHHTFVFQRRGGGGNNVRGGGWNPPQRSQPAKNIPVYHHFIEKINSRDERRNKNDDFMNLSNKVPCLWFVSWK